MDPEEAYADAVRRERRDGSAVAALLLFAAAGLVLYFFRDDGGHDLESRIQSALVDMFVMSIAGILGVIGLAFALKAVLLARGRR